MRRTRLGGADLEKVEDLFAVRLPDDHVDTSGWTTAEVRDIAEVRWWDPGELATLAPDAVVPEGSRAWRTGPSAPLTPSGRVSTARSGHGRGVPPDSSGQSFARAGPGSFSCRARPRMLGVRREDGRGRAGRHDGHPDGDDRRRWGRLTCPGTGRRAGPAVGPDRHHRHARAAGRHDLAGRLAGARHRRRPGGRRHGGLAAGHQRLVPAARPPPRPRCGDRRRDHRRGRQRRRPRAGDDRARRPRGRRHPAAARRPRGDRGVRPAAAAPRGGRHRRLRPRQRPGHHPAVARLGRLDRTGPARRPPAGRDRAADRPPAGRAPGHRPGRDPGRGARAGPPAGPGRPRPAGRQHPAGHEQRGADRLRGAPRPRPAQPARDRGHGTGDPAASRSSSWTTTPASSWSSSRCGPPRAPWPSVGALLDHASAEGRAPAVALVDVGEVAAEVVATLPAETLGTVRRRPAPGPGPGVGGPPAPAARAAEPGHQRPDARRLARGADRRDHRVHRGRRRGHGRRRRARDPRARAHGGLHGGDRAGGHPGPRTRTGHLPLDRPPPRRPNLGRRQRARRRGRVLRAAVAGRRTPLGHPRGRGTARAGRLVDLADETADQRTRATSSSSGSSRATSPASYRPGSAPATLRTSSPASSTRRTSPGTV